MNSTPIMARTYDAEAVNAFCNDPDVLPGLCLGLDHVDVTQAIADDRNVFFIGEHGGAFFHWSAPGTYDAHDFFVKEGRGSWAKAASFSMLIAMFHDYGARLLWAQTPVENKACRVFNRILGFKSEGFSRVRLMPDADPVEVETFVMEEAPCQ